MTVREDAVLNYPLVLNREGSPIGHVQIGSLPAESNE